MATNPTSASLRSAPALLRDGDAGATRERILDAAFRRLVGDGYAALSVREIARDAGVNHALINYHFGSKDQLVVDVLDAVNQRLLARQTAMYASAEGFADKWAAARRFYDEDLASGFVRLQAELWAASLADARLREKFVPRLLAWKQLVLGAVRTALASAQAAGVSLPPPLSADVIACWISEFWLGMEFVDLLGVESERAQHRTALEAMQSLLQALDAKVAALPAAAATPMRKTRR